MDESNTKPLNPEAVEKFKHSKAQSKYRDRLRKSGHVRLEINIPPELFAKLKPHLRFYRNGAFTGKAIVNLLSEIEFK